MLHGRDHRFFWCNAERVRTGLVQCNNATGSLPGFATGLDQIIFNRSNGLPAMAPHLLWISMPRENFATSME